MASAFRPFVRSSTSALRSSSHLSTSPLLTRNPLLLRHLRLLSTDARAKISSAISRHPLVLFMKGTPQFPQCGFSRAVVSLLELHEVDPTKVQTYNCLEDQELREGIKEFSDWPTIPQVYISGEFMGGCDTMLEMHKNGELEKLLAEKDLIRPQGAQAPDAATA